MKTFINIIINFILNLFSDAEKREETTLNNLSWDSGSQPSIPSVAGLSPDDNNQLAESSAEDYAEDWFAVGGGNSISLEQLSWYFNAEQIKFLTELSPTCYRGILLNKVDYPCHYDCHPAVEEHFDNFLVVIFNSLAKTTTTNTTTTNSKGVN